MYVKLEIVVIILKNLLNASSDLAYLKTHLTDIYLCQNLIFYVKKVFKVMIITVFTVLIAGSIQNVLATHDLEEIFKRTPIKNSEYHFHLQLIYRNADGGLISVTEATNGHYIPHDVTDDAFDTLFGKKEIVVVDNIKYEKVQYYQKSIAEDDQIWTMVGIEYPELIYESETVRINEAIFGAWAPLSYVEEGDTVNAKWNIFREFN